MKRTEITKSGAGWLKHILLLCVTLLGLAGFTYAANYPFPQNYQYPYGEIYTGSNVQSKIQSLYTAWKSKYYVESGNYARIKFVQDGESGSNTVSEGIAYGMLIMVYMDNSTNNTQSCFDKLWNYYKLNMNNNGVMNWKVNAFTGQVTSGSGNANGATDAELDVAQALLLAHKQWGSDGDINYLTAAKQLINSIWTYEVNGSQMLLKPGDAFDDYKNPCYFITNAMQLFADVEAKEGWTTHNWTGVINGCYSLMLKTRNSSTGLIPDWCYADGSYLSGLIDSKFESIFGYDAVRIPWRMAHAYAWYGHDDAQDIADKITTWCKGKYPNPDNIKDGYTLNGNEGTGGLGGSLSSWGTSSNACFKAGLSIGSMVSSDHSSYLSQCWSVGSATDAYGAYYTHTTQLLFMLCATGNMPNFWDMLPVFDAAETNSDGSIIYLDWSKEISSSVSSSSSYFTVKTYENDEDASATSISVSSVARSSSNNKQLILTLAKEISEPVITLTYNGTVLTAKDDGATADKFSDKPVTNKITSMEPYPITRYTDIYGTIVYVQWSKELKISSASASDFTVYVDGTSVTPTSLALNADDASILEVKFDESVVPSASSDVTISYTGGTITSSTGTKTAKAFTKATVQNYYMSVDCFEILLNETNNFNVATGWTGAGLTWSANVTDLPSGAKNSSGYYMEQSSASGSSYICARGQASATSYTSFAETFFTSKAKIKGRIYVTSNDNKESLTIRFTDADSWGEDGGYSNYRGITLSATDMGEKQWYEFEGTYNTPESGVTYDGIQIFSSGTQGGDGGALCVYFDYLELCPPDPVVEPENGRLSFDGYQVEIKFSTAMKIPTETSAVVIKEGSTSHAVSSISTKTGDASTLIFVLEEPISDQEAAITATLSSSNAKYVKSADGRSSEAFTNFEIANLVGITVSTGWYDDFDDASDYVTLNVGGTKKITVEENASDSKLTVSYAKVDDWQALSIQTYTADDGGFVMDLTGREKVSFKAKLASGTSPTKVRIDVKDFINDRTSDGMGWTDIALTNSYKEFEFDLSSYLFNQWTTGNTGDVDRTNIYQVLIYFVSEVSSDGGTITLPTCDVDFDYISIGSALTLTVTPSSAITQSKGVSENGTIYGQSTSDGLIYVVPYETNPQYTALEEAVVDGTGVKVECTADTKTTISLEGIGYGFFYAYAYDPIAGALSTKVPVYVNDVTAPVITECYEEATISADNSFTATVNEDGRLYLIPTSLTTYTEATIIDQSYYGTDVSGGEPTAFSIEELISRGVFDVGASFKLIALDASGNISEPVPTDGIEIEYGTLTFEVDKTSAEIGSDLTVTASRKCTAYLVSSDVAVTLSNIATVAIASQATNAYLKAVVSTEDVTEEGEYYIYVSDGESVVGPSAKITLESGDHPVVAISLDNESFTLNTSGTLTSAEIGITFEPLNSSDMSLSFSGQGDYVSIDYDKTANKSGQGTITVTPLVGTNDEYITVTVTADGASSGSSVSKTFEVKVVQMPTAINLSGDASMDIGSSQTLTYSFEPTEGLLDAQKGVTWSTSDKTIATVSNGKVSAVAEGSVTITATSTANSAILGTFDITVNALGLTAIYVGSEDDANDGLLVKTEQTYNMLELDQEYYELYFAFDPAEFSEKIVVTSSDESVVELYKTHQYSANDGFGYLELDYYGGTATVTLSVASNPSITAVVTFTDESTGCKASAPTTKEIASSFTSCAGSDAQLTASFSDASKAVWYSAETGGTALYTGNTYAPSDNAAGSYTYYVAKYDASLACESETRSKVTLTVQAKPVLDLSSVETAMCADDAAQVLSATPAGGVWSGTGVTAGSFDPSVGSAVLTYTVTDGACEVSEDVEITVTESPSPIIKGLESSYCSSADAVTLTATPAGGTFTINGTTATSFDPSAVTAGDNEVVYTVTVNGCAGTASQTVSVTAAPVVDLSSVATTACAGDEIALTPTTGTWSGTGVSGTTFTASTAGSYELNYVEGTAGCTSSDAVTITVSKSDVPKVTPATVTVGGAVPALTATATGTITWYDATKAKLGEGASYTPETSTESAATYTFYATNTENGCESEMTATTLTVTDCETTAPTIAEVEAICEGDDFPTLTATGTGIIWYDAVVDGTKLGEGDTYTPSAAGTYYASQTDGCEGPRASVVVSVNAKPAAPTLTGASSCASDAVKALTSVETADWYIDKSAAAVQTSAKSYTPSSVSETTTFYATQTVNGCTSDFAEVVYTIKATPAAPTVGTSVACIGSTSDYTVSVTESAAGATLQWYDAAGAPKGTEATQAVSGVTTAKDYAYTVTQTVDGCESEAATATLTVVALPTPSITNAASYNSKSTESVDLAATPAGGVFTLDGATATSFVPSSLDLGSHTIEYTYTDENGCVGSATMDFEVSEVIVPISAVSFSETQPSVDENGTIDLSSLLVLDPVDATSPTYSWVLNNTTYASIDENGVFTAGSVSKDTKVVATVTVTTPDGTSVEKSVAVTIIKGAVPVTKITVQAPALSQEEGSTFVVTATVEPDDADDPSITWSINGSGATIDQDGNVTVTGTSGETFDIVATANDGSSVTGSATITIIDQVIPVTGVSFDDTQDYTITASGSIDLSQYMTYEPSDASIKSIVWSSISQYVTVDATTGVVSGKTVSLATDAIVTVKVTTLDGTTKSANVTVTVIKDPVYVSGITIDKAYTLEEGATKTLTATVTPSNADNREYTWSVKSGEGGTIDPETGEITVTGTAGDVFSVVATAKDEKAVESNECVITVVQKTIPVTSISASVDEVEVVAGESSQTLTISFSPDNTTQTGYSLVAGSTSFSYVDDRNGNISISGVKGGTSTLTIKSTDNASVSKIVTITVIEKVQSISISGNTTLNVGNTSQMSAIVTATTATDKTVTWSSSDPSVASISESGLVTALSAGFVTINATANDGSNVVGTTTVIVSTIPVSKITASNVSLQIEETAVIKPTITPATATYKTLVYTVENESIASVDANGTITALAVGTTTVTILAPVDNVSTTITVTVTPVLANTDWLYRLIYDDKWGAYAVYEKIKSGEIQIGIGKGMVSPLVQNEFQNAWMAAQDALYAATTPPDYLSQEEVDKAADRLYDAIIAMGTVIDAIEVVTINSKVYPTVATDYVIVEADNMKSVAVYSAQTGKLILQQATSGDELEINVANLAQGVYKVVITTVDGMAIETFMK